MELLGIRKPDSEHKIQLLPKCAAFSVLCPVPGRRILSRNFQSWMPFSQLDSGVFDQETISLMRSVLDEAWAKLSPSEQAKTLKSDLATRILRAASLGERDPVLLRDAALVHLTSPPLASS